MTVTQDPNLNQNQVEEIFQNPCCQYSTEKKVYLILKTVVQMLF